MASGHANANPSFAQLSAVIQQQVLATNAQVAALQANTKQQSFVASTAQKQIAANVKMASIGATANVATNPVFAKLGKQIQQQVLANLKIASGGGAGGAGGGAFGIAQLNAIASGSPKALLSSFGGLAATAAIAAGTLTSMAAAASPNVWGKFTGSVESVSIAIGSKFVPYLNTAADALQAFGGWIDKNFPDTVRDPNTGKEEYGWGSPVRKTLSPLLADLARWAMPETAEKLEKKFGKIGTPEFDRNFEAASGGLPSEKGLPKSQYSSFSDYIDRLDIAGLRGNTIEAENERKQLENSQMVVTNTAGILSALQTYLQNNPVAFRN